MFGWLENILLLSLREINSSFANAYLLSTDHGMNSLGTTTGAYWSGQAVARRICQLYGLHVPDDVGEGEPSEEDLKQKDFDEGNRTPDAANLNGVAL